jgi:aminoglycoside phosphotransferase (APT) family kinase protein
VLELAQPNSSHIAPDVLAGVLAGVASEACSEPVEVVHRDQHSNDFAEVRFRDGRALIVKRGRFEWAGPRFETSRIASRLIRERTGVAVPVPLAVPPGVGERPIEIYWRVDLPTLQELWPRLDGPGRTEVLRSWGRLTAQLHSVRLQGFGPLSDPAVGTTSLESYLGRELKERLLPAVAWEWPVARPAVERLAELVAEVAGRAGSRSRLCHNDLHMGNVLCQLAVDGPHCVGLIDLETAIAAPPEADLAAIEVHHGPHFSQPIEGDWQRAVRDGYGEDVDPWVVNFYRALHLVNMGFYSAMIGHDWHADRVAETAIHEVDRLEATVRAGRLDDVAAPLLPLPG